MEHESVELRYGRGRCRWRLPRGTRWSLLQPAADPAPVDEETLLARGLDELGAALGAARLPRGGSALLVIPDRTRRCRLEFVLPRLLDRLERDFALRARALVAGGSHQPAGEAEIAELVDAASRRRCPVEVHDCDDGAQLEERGATAAGTPLQLNRRLRQADVVIAVAAVRFHYFAGFGGGPKMVVPGLAGRETIRRNHARVVDSHGAGLHPACREGNLANNPVWQDLADGARRAGTVYSLQLALAAGERIADCCGGLLEETQRRLLPAVARCEGAPLGARADVVVASAGGFPADIDLVQAHKAIHHAFQALRPGGAMVVLAECGGGIGSVTLMEWLALDSPAAMAERLRRDYQLNGHTALAMRQKSAAARIVLVSALDPDLVCRTGMQPAGGIDEAWHLLQAAGAAPAHGCIIPDAAATVPRPAEEET